MEYKAQDRSKASIAPRLIIHGGAGNITPQSITPEKYTEFHDSLLTILSTAHRFMTEQSSFPLQVSGSASALDTVTFAVSLLENNPLFNSGHGAVFTRDGTQEMEASVMVSRGKKKRGVGLMGLKHVKNPIKLAREMLVRGEQDLEGGNSKGAKGAQGHSQLAHPTAERLARDWGLEMVDKKYFFVQSRWDEHIKGLEREDKGEGIVSWSHKEYIPQGTCGAVALDSEGVIAVATSTGGLTNKLPGRIGDTPTIGSGFWAEEWEQELPTKEDIQLKQPGPALMLSDSLRGLLADCFPSLTTYQPIPVDVKLAVRCPSRLLRATAMSGTGNGDSFLRTNAARTASAIVKYRNTDSNKISLQDAIREVSGPGGELERSAGNRWHKTGEGEGGMIGIELQVELDGHRITKSTSRIAEDFNCGGMWRAKVGSNGKAVMRAFQIGQPGLENFKGEGQEYDLIDWFDETL
ncbi:nucleophile aminohydrolase [Calycina marina]|uniref:Nucleophile aminohydrolase n=1 Tax=Calycina marina TaxID=1763456 RepID=A0A9P8CDT0_9HELO|nr:nucleophile aminohydrolase [Calycina marina]